MLTAELTLKTEAGEKVVEVREGSPLFAGRSVECDLYLPSPAVSRRHAVFLTLRGQCGIKDLESANGTYLNGKRIARPMRLRDGDVIQIATFFIEYHTLGEGRASCRKGPGHDDVAVAAVAQALDLAGADEAQETVAAPADAEDTDQVAIEDAAVPVDDGGGMASLLGPGGDFEPEPEPEPEVEPEPDAMAEPEVVAESDPDATSDPELPVAEEEEPPKKLAAETVIAARESLRRTPKPPPAPKLTALEGIDDIETGDGSGDSAFVEGEEEQDAPDPQLALAKAAAEAGLVGEFNPEPEAEGSAPAPDPVSASAVPMGKAVQVPGTREPNPNAVPIDDEFRSAIESRLFLYSFLADLKAERDALLASKADMPDAVKSECSRMDREMDKMPPPERAEDMITKRTQKRKDLKEKIKEAKAKGTAMPPLPSKEMRQAEDIAINQWTLIAQSAREALPAAYAAGYKIMEGELLTGELEKAGIDAKTVLGGAAYLLALDELLEETKHNRAVTKARLASLKPVAEKKADGGGGKGLLGGLFGSKPADDDEDDEDEDDEDDLPAESFEELTETEALLARRAAWIAQEATAIELALIKEFWQVYTKVAVHYLCGKVEMPMAVRAFLRYGAVGFNRWWMKDEVRQHVVDSCTKDAQEAMDISLKSTYILYADEYLSAVHNLECTPAMDENLEMNGRNTPEWKADKALRKLIYSRTQKTLLSELCDSLGTRVQELEHKADELDVRIKNLLPGSRNFKALKSELSMERQAQKVEISKLTKLVEKIKDTTLGELQEAIEETEQRFDSGELPRPTPEFMVEREVDAVRKIGRLLANLKERFLPLVLRDSFHPDTDACNDRGSILGEIADIERRDPSIFIETLIPSKKKANRVDLRLSPVIVLVPSAGLLAFSWNPRQKPEDGRLGIPTCFIRPRLRERQMMYLMSDFRWDTSKASAGMDVMNSETIVAAFMSVRWDWRKRSKEGREKGLVYTDQNDRTNWRRVYEAYMQTAYDGGKKLYNRNYDFYERIIGKYFDMPEGVELLRK